jgi:hypothetical protein
MNCGTIQPLTLHIHTEGGQGAAAPMNALAER